MGQSTIPINGGEPTQGGVIYFSSLTERAP
jgi:hypothetical protein